MHQPTFKLAFGILVLFVSICSFVIASDNQLIQQCGGDQELIIGCKGDAQNYFESWTSNVTEEVGDDGGDDGGGGGGGGITTTEELNETATLNETQELDEGEIGKGEEEGFISGYRIYWIFGALFGFVCLLIIILGFVYIRRKKQKR